MTKSNSEIPDGPSTKEMLAKAEHAVAMLGIERKAHWLASDAKGLSEYVTMLRMQPPYMTRALDEMRNAQASLESALEIVKGAIATYNKLPVSKS